MGKESLLLRVAIISMISTSRGSHNVNNPPSRIMMINDPITVVVGEKKLSPASSVLESAPEKGALFWSELFLLFYPTFFLLLFLFFCCVAYKFQKRAARDLEVPLHIDGNGTV